MNLLQQFAASTNRYDPPARGDSWNRGPHLHGSPTYWPGGDRARGFLYVWGEKDVLKLYRYDKAKQRVEEPPLEGTVQAPRTTMPGGMLSVSSHGTDESSAIVWATVPMSSFSNPHPAALHAFSGVTLKYLWGTHYGALAHWAPPTIAAGKVYVAATGLMGDGILLKYELGRGDQDQRDRPPKLPGCINCHTQGSSLPDFSARMDMHDHFPNGGAMHAGARHTLDRLAPPPGYDMAAMLEGNGLSSYRAETGREAGEKLVWVLEDSVADLTEVTTTEMLKAKRAPVTVRFSRNSVWAASDGSKLVAETIKTAPAPTPSDTDWVLFKVLENSPSGLLGGHAYVQRVHTHAGRPPITPPKRAGEQASVPYRAEYRLYRPSSSVSGPPGSGPVTSK